MTLGIRSKLFLISLGLIVVSVVAAYSYARTELEAELTARAEKTALVHAVLVARAAEAELRAGDHAARAGDLARDLAGKAGAHVALFDAEGNLLGSSGESKSELAEFAARREVRGLAERRPIRPLVMRSGSTLHVAVPYGSPRASGAAGGVARGVVRVSQPLTELEGAVAALGRTLTLSAVLAIALAVVLSSAASGVASRTARALTRVASRMATGDLGARTRSAASDEFGELGRALDRLAKGLSASLGELREERDRLSGILSGMQEGVLLLDADGRIALLNPSLREMLLLGPDAVGKTLLEVIRNAELKELLDRARRSLSTSAREIEIGNIKPRRLLVRVARLSDSRDQVFAVFVDVTEMRRLESMRRDFVANVSHELRTPVTAIRSAAETLLGGMPEDRAVLEQFLGIIARNAERLRDLVEDVLNLSRIESRELKLNLEPLELRALYGQVLSLFRERADERQIRLENQAGPELARVHADRRALEHVLTNLVDNAVKYCGSGATVRVGGIEQDEGVRLFVADDGPGIEERHLPRLFERFYRVDAGRSRELGGTGLGLSIVKHLVEAMGGTVQVESGPGRGTTFSFTLKKLRPESEHARVA